MGLQQLTRSRDWAQRRARTGTQLHGAGSLRPPDRAQREPFRPPAQVAASATGGLWEVHLQGDRTGEDPHWRLHRPQQAVP